MKKQDVYKAYGIEHDTKTGKIFSPVGWVSPMLINGNQKVGKGVWTFSTLPGTAWYRIMYGGELYEVKGTCVCDCPGCYATNGFYKTESVKVALGIRTVIARGFSNWLFRALVAQIIADGIKLVRIHAAGDFFSREYIDLWRAVAMACPAVIFWTYTKNPDAENAFDDIENLNIVKSLIPGRGVNYGHCSYVISLYYYLIDMGVNVYICRCGIDKNQHCVNCTGCTKNRYVLFVEHSTDYKAEEDPFFGELKTLIDSQPSQLAA